MKLIVAALLGIGTLSLAQTPKPVISEAKAPTFNSEQKAELFKLEAQVSSAQLAVEHAQQEFSTKQQALQSEAVKLSAVCGKQYNLQLDGQGDPICVAKPEEPKK